MRSKPARRRWSDERKSPRQRSDTARRLIRGTGFMKRRLPSFGLDVGCSDYLGPLLIFVGNEFSEIGGCHRPRLHAQLSEPRYQLGIGKTCIGLAVDFADDLGRRVLGNTEPVPLATFVIR